MIEQYSRRDIMRGLVGATAAMAFPPLSFAQPGPPPGMIALRYNENPYGPSPAALKAAEEAVAMGAYYADDLQAPLLRAIADKNNVGVENLVLSSGSNEALQAAFVAWGRKGKIVLPSLTYSDHLDYAEKKGARLVRVPLRDDLSIDLDAITAAVTDDVSLVYICNPNNPTAHTLDGDELRGFCRKVGRKATVMIDEAYNEITDRPDYSSMVDLVRDGENVIIMRTFSKIFGMAGLRIGYGIARPDIVRTIADYVMAWPNGVGLAAAEACYTDENFIQFSRSKIFAARDIVVETLRDNGIEPLPSQTNFVFADIGRNASEFQRQMAERKILIRGRFEGYPNFIRISMGRIEDVEVFQSVFTDLIRA
jgi:histidinol-phosphate aminotransferase